MTLYTVADVKRLLKWHERKVQRIAAVVGHDRRIGRSLVFSAADLRKLRRWKPMKTGPKTDAATA